MSIPKRVGIRFHTDLRARNKRKPFFQDTAKIIPLAFVKDRRCAAAYVKGAYNRLLPKLPGPGSNFLPQRFQVTIDFFLVRNLAVEGTVAAFASAKGDMEVTGKPQVYSSSSFPIFR
jgi:hypothetical protein